MIVRARDGARGLAGELVVAMAFAAVACVGALPGAGDDAGSGGMSGAGASGGGVASGRGGVGGSAAAVSGGGMGNVTGSGIGGSGVTGFGGSAITGSSGTTGTGPGGPQPPRLVIFYTRWGTSYPEWWPTGTERSFTLSSILAPLERYKSQLIILSGLTNANVSTDSGGTKLGPSAATDGAPDLAMQTLLTGRRVPDGGGPGYPSLDTVVGDCGGSAGPPLRLAVGQFANDVPGVSFDAVGAIPGERDPNAAAIDVLEHSVSTPDPNGDLASFYPALGQAHIGVAVEALARSKACVVTLEWGDDFIPAFLGLTQRVHELSHTTSDLYSAVQAAGGTVAPTPFAKLQNFYAQMFLALLDAMSNAPLGAGTLLDQSVVMWISETGQGSDHLGRYIPVVIAGSGGGRLDVGRYIQIKPHAPPTGTFVDIDSIVRTQGDLLAALGSVWGFPSFGDPLITRQPLTEILKR